MKFPAWKKWELFTTNQKDQKYKESFYQLTVIYFQKKKNTRITISPPTLRLKRIYFFMVRKNVFYESMMNIYKRNKKKPLRVQFYHKT